MLHVILRIDRSYVAWGTVDRLLRQALRRAVDSNPSSSVQHVYQALQLGEDPSAENLQTFYSTVYSTFESLARQICYRLPWEWIESQGHYGVSAKAMEAFLRNTYIPLVSKMCKIETISPRLAAALGAPCIEVSLFVCLSLKIPPAV